MSEKTETPRDQPDDVATQDAPRPPDNVVVTSDLPPEAESGAADSTPPTAAAEGDKPDGTKEPPSAGDDKNKRKPRDRPAERKIRKLTGRLSRAEGENQDLKQQITDKDAEIARLKAAQPQPVEPQLEDFKTPQEYAKAYAKYEADVAAYTERPDSRPTSPPPPPPPADDPLADARADFLDAGREQLGDEFAEALQEETYTSLTMAEFLFDDLEVGPAIYVHLSNNPKDAREIYDMPAHKAVKALEELADRAKAGQLDVEGTLKVEPPPDNKGGAAPPETTRAPEPPSSTRDGTNANLAPNPEDESMDDYAARRRKEEARRAGYNV